MPPFREGKIEVDRRFTGEALHELRDIGHGHRINIVDASYDIPRDSRVIDYPGSSANALLGVFRIIPVEDNEVTLMLADHLFGPEEAEQAIPREERRLLGRAYDLFDEAIDVVLDEVDGVEEIHGPNGEPRNGEHGFYAIANNSQQPSLFIRTTDDLPYACASIVAGHSQRTE